MKEFPVDTPKETVEKRAALLALLEKKKRLANNQSASIAIPRRNLENQYCRLSPAQSGIWYMEQLLPGTTMFNVPFAYRLRGVLNQTILEDSLRIIVQRHEILRTKFLTINDEPRQWIDPKIDISFNIEDMTEIEPDQIESTLLSAIRHEASQPFDLENDLPIRFRLFIIAPEECVLVVTAHHLVIDGASIGIFLNELSALYEARFTGSQPNISPALLQYGDYSEWLNQWLQGKELESQIAYWKKQIGDDHSPVEFPSDKHRPEDMGTSGSGIEFVIPVETIHAIRSECTNEGYTLNMVTLAAFLFVIGRYTQQPHVRVGVSSANRRLEQTDKMIGMFANTLVFGAAIDLQDPFKTLLNNVKRQQLESFDYQDVRPEMISQDLHIESYMDRSPFLQIAFNYLNKKKLAFTLPGIDIKEYHMGSRSVSIEFFLTIIEKDDRVIGYAEYCDSLYSQGMVQSIVDTYLHVLQQLSRQLNIRMADISLVPDDQKRKQLETWNNTNQSYSENCSIMRFFQEQVALNPTQPALWFNNHSIDYNHLNQLSNLIAWKLDGFGVQAGDRVAIIANRGWELYAAILGVLKIGAAYVPIDPNYPKERIDYIINDSDSRIVLHTGIDIALTYQQMDMCQSGFWQGSTFEFQFQAKKDDAMYVIYTSGTTGQAKGVVVSHRGVVNICQWFVRQYSINHHSRILQMTNFVFDPFVEQFFGALYAGATLYPVDDKIRTDADSLFEYLNQNKISIADLPQLFLHELSKLPKLTGLEVLIAGGELLGTDLNNQLCRLGYKLFNHYGPTETTVDAITHACTEIPSNEIVPIGRPIDNTMAFILQGETLCPIGMPGELCISGHGVALGYLNQTDLTAARFVRNPFGPGLLYRTGDRASWRVDGCINFLGRLDEQVKIHGFRIELPEIESVLQTIPGIENAVAIVRKSPQGESQIHAFYTAAHEMPSSRITEILTSKLPAYMIPAVLVQIPAIPLTVNGKVAKQALPMVDFVNEMQDQEPQDENQNIVHSIFCDILGLEKIGIDRSFFELGGHSLKATRLVNRLAATSGTRIGLLEFFRLPTIRAVAKMLKADAIHQAIPKAIDCDEYPMSATQKRIYLVNQLEKHGIAYNMPQCFRLNKDVDVSRLHQALQDMVNCHEILRTSFHLVGDELVQRVHLKICVDFTIIENSQDSIDKIFKSFLNPFDLGQPSQLRLCLAHRDDGNYLFYDIHHIISDGISNQLFFQELASIYGGDYPVIPGLQYKDYSQWMHSRDLSTQRDYWVNQYQNNIPNNELPWDYPRPSENNFEGSVTNDHISLELSRKIKEFALQNGSTEYVFFLSVIMVLIAHYGNSEDVVIGSPIANRPHHDTETMLGMFVNTLAIRGKPASNRSFVDFLHEMRHVALHAYDNQEFPFEDLVKAVIPRRDLSRTPLFDVLFAYQDHHPVSPLESTLTLEEMLFSRPVAKFDLTFNITSTQQGYAIGLEYNTGLFRAETAGRIIGHLRNVVEILVNHPKIMLRDLCVLSEAERKDQIQHCLAPSIEPQGTVHQLFEEQVAKNPSSIAVHFEGHCYTYAELNQRVNQLAWHLRSKGVGPDIGVGLLIERSLDIMVGILGILKAGGAYVPIDTMNPPERIAAILQESDVGIVLTHSQTVGICPYLVDVEAISLDSDWPKIGKLSTENPPANANAQNLMYIIFTSGSTGQPKGVMIEHGSFLNYLSGIIPALGINEPLNFAIVSTFAADLGTTNVYVPLCTGGQVHILSYERAADPEKFAEYFRANRIDAMKIVPSHFEALQVLDDPQAVVPKRILIFAGEACKWEHVRKAHQLNPQCRLFNNYGPTETTVSMLCHSIDPENKARHLVVPLGTPLDGVRTYILNTHGQIVPHGVLGELYIGGPGLARAYYKLPNLTTEKFLPDHMNRQSGQRVYRTGDMVKYLHDSSIGIYGRIDRQIKIRGYRVEPEGIEAVLRSTPGIQQALITVVTDPQGDTRLVAYLVRHQAVSPQATTAELKQHLRSKLPDYMVPAFFMDIPEIPRNANGKTDFKRLPTLDQNQAMADRILVLPRTSEESRIAAIWSEILDIKDIGIDDNFFDLGGDSFKSIRAVKKIDPSLSVVALIKRPTIRQLAEYLCQEERPQSSEILLELSRPVTAKKQLNLICIPYGGGNSITYKPLADAMPDGFSLYAVQIPGHDFRSGEKELKPNSQVAQECLEYIQSHVQGPVAIYGQCVGGALAIQLGALLETHGIEVRGVFQAANFPDARLPGKFFEFLHRLLPEDRFISDKVYKETLKSIGGGDETANREEQDFLLKAIRHDAREYSDYFTNTLNYGVGYRKLKAPICCVIGERDRTTEFFAERYQEWRSFSDTVDLRTIDGAGHFFHKHQTMALRDIILDQIKIWEQGETAIPPNPECQPTAVANQKTPKPSLRLLVLIAIGQVISLLGSSISGFAMGVWVYRQSGSVADFATITLFGLIPGLVLAPFAGAIADRFDRRKVMILGDIIAAVGTVLIAILLFTSGIQLWYIYLATCLGAIAGAFQRPAFMAAMTQIVPKRYLGQANGLVQLGLSTGQIIAPAIAGALVIGIGMTGVVIIDFATFLVSIITLLLVRFPNALFRKREEPFHKELLGGWRFILKRKSMIALVVFFIVDNFLATFASILITPLLLTFTTATSLGLIVAAQSAGILVGSFIISIWGGTRRRSDGMIGFVMLSGASFVLFGLQPSIILTAIALFSVGIAISFMNTHWAIIIQTKVGLELQGRVFSVNQMLALIMAPLAVIAGTMADNIFEPFMKSTGSIQAAIGSVIGTGAGRGMALMFIMVGLLELLWGCVGLAYRPLRNIETILPDAVPDAVIVKNKDQLQAMIDKRQSVQKESPADARRK